MQQKKQYDAEAAAKKEQDFLRQEEIKKRNEEEFRQARRQLMREQAETDRETAIVKAEAEGRAAIEREQKNEEIHMRKLKAEKEEERKMRLETIKETFSHVKDLTSDLGNLITDPQKMMTIGGSVFGMALGIYAAKTGTGVLGNYVQKRLGKPSLVRETSRGDYGFLAGRFMDRLLKRE